MKLKHRSLALLLPILLQAMICTGQTGKIVKVNLDKDEELKFDKPTYLTLTFQEKQNINFVSYMKLRKHMTLGQTIEWEKNKDSLLRKKYPFNYSTYFDPNGHRLHPGNIKPIKGGKITFHNIPDEKLVTTDSGKTLQVLFQEHTFYNRDTLRYYNTYYNPDRHIFRKRLRGKSLPKQYDYLEPRSRYALIIASSAGTSVLPILNLLHEGNEESAFKMYDSLTKAQVTKLEGLTFLADFGFFCDFYQTRLKKQYDLKDNLQKAIQQREKLFSAYRISSSDSSILRLLVDRLSAEQSANLASTGMTRDSIKNLLSSISSLLDATSIDLSNFIRGNYSLIDRVTTSEILKPNKTENRTLTAQQLSNLKVYLTITRYGSVTPPIDSIRLIAMNLLSKKLNNWIDSINLTSRNLKQIESIEADILKTTVTEEKFSDATFLNVNSYVQNFETRGQLTFVPDFGVIGYGFLPWNRNKGFRDINTYLGFHISWRPMDKEVDFGSIPGKKWYSLHHWSTMIGITLASIEEAGRRKNFFGNNNLLIGFGYRFSDLFKFVGGVMLFKQQDTKYLLTDMSTAATPYAGISLDLRLRKIIESIADAFVTK